MLTVISVVCAVAVWLGLSAVVCAWLARVRTLPTGPSKPTHSKALLRRSAGYWGHETDAYSE